MNTTDLDYKKNRLKWLKNQYQLRQTHSDLPGGFHHEEQQEQMLRQIQKLEEEINAEIDGSDLISGCSILIEPFSGREKQLKKCEELLRRLHVVLFSGIGGIGKSAAACAYAQDHQYEYSQVIYLPASSSLFMSIVDDTILKIRDLEYSKRRYRSRNAYFRAKCEALADFADSRHLLIILDDVTGKDRKALEQLLSIKADFILTARDIAADFDLDCIPPKCQIGLRQLEEEDVPGFVKALHPESFNAASARLFKDFTASSGRHPLAMKLWLAADHPDENTIYNDLSDIILKKGMLRKDEKQVLTNMALMPGAGVNELYFLTISGLCRESVDAVVRRSLLSRTADHVLLMHPLIRQTVMHSIRPSYANSKNLLKNLADNVNNAWNEERKVNLAKEAVVLSVCACFPHLYPWMYQSFSELITFLWITEHFEEAAQMADRLFASVLQKYGEPHQITGEVALRTAAVYHNAMQFDKARGWYFRAYENLSACTPATKDYCRRLVSSISRIARIFMHENNDAEAVKYIELGLEKTEQMKQVSQSYAFLQSSYLHRRYAEILLKQGNLPEAEIHRSRMHCEMESYFSQHGMEEVRMNDIRETDIEFAIYRKDYRSALTLLYENLSVFIRYRGNIHEDTLHCRQKIAVCLRALEEKKGALAISRSLLFTLENEYPYETKWHEEVKDLIRSMN